MPVIGGGCSHFSLVAGGCDWWLLVAVNGGSCYCFTGGHCRLS